jgi:hypothetical protein
MAVGTFRESGSSSHVTGFGKCICRRVGVADSFCLFHAAFRRAMIRLQRCFISPTSTTSAQGLQGVVNATEARGKSGLRYWPCGVPGARDHQDMGARLTEFTLNAMQAPPPVPKTISTHATQDDSID